LEDKIDALHIDYYDLNILLDVANNKISTFSDKKQKYSPYPYIINKKNDSEYTIFDLSDIN
jgi:hypothetical protein